MAKYCIECGARLEPFDENGVLRQRCEKCGWIYYLNPYPAAATLTVCAGEILLERRGIEPRIGMWGLPSGFEEYDEPPQDAAVRETLEETGLDVELTGLFGVNYVSETDKRCILVIYTAVPRDPSTVAENLVAGDDAVDARFFAFDALPPDIAFISHREAIEQYRVILAEARK